MDVGYLLRNRGFTIDEIKRTSADTCQYYGTNGDCKIHIQKTSSSYFVTATYKGEVREKRYGFWDGEYIDRDLSEKFPAISKSDWDAINTRILQQEGFEFRNIKGVLYGNKENASIVIKPHNTRKEVLLLSAYKGQRNIVDEVSLSRVQLDTLITVHGHLLFD